MKLPSKPTLPPWTRNRATWVYLVFATMLVTGLVLNLTGGADKLDPVTFDDHASVTDLVDDVSDGVVQTITYFDDTGQALAEYTAEDTTAVLVAVPAAYSETFLAAVIDADVDLVAGAGTPHAPVAAGTETVSAAKSWGGTLGTLGLIGLVAFWLYRTLTRQQDAAVRKEEEKRRKETEASLVSPPKTRFADVAGADEAVADLTEMVEYLQDPAKFTRLGAKPPRGALLVGPPGTGKTLLARAVAGEAGVPFISASGSDFVEKYVGVGAKRVRELFESARKHEKAIVFIDELDALARRRSEGDVSGGGSEGENTLIALLTELDGFTERGNILVLGATNRPDVLDSAVTRPGRLDRKVEVPNPDPRGREQILAVHARNKPLASDVDLVALARRTPGFSGAQLEAVVNEACMVAARTGRRDVNHDCFDAAVATVAMGRARTSAVVTEHDRTVTAWHEAGHTVAALLLAEADDPVSVTIVPRGPAGGVTWMAGSDDIFLSRRKAHAQLVVAMGGRAAEELYLGGEFTSGPSGDLESATRTATAMVTRYAMSDLGFAVRDPKSAEVTKAVDALLVDAYERASRLLTEHRDFVEAVAKTLLFAETLRLADIVELADRLSVPIRVAGDLPPAPTPRSVGKRDGDGDGVVVPFRPAPEQTPAPVPVPVPVAHAGVVGLVRAVWVARRRRSSPTAPAS